MGFVVPSAIWNVCDPNTEPFWQFDWCVSDTCLTIVSEDPLRVRLSLPCGGDELDVLTDETVSVIETTVRKQAAQQ